MLALPRVRSALPTCPREHASENRVRAQQVQTLRDRYGGCVCLNVIVRHLRDRTKTRGGESTSEAWQSSKSGIAQPLVQPRIQRG